MQNEDRDRDKKGGAEPKAEGVKVEGIKGSR